MYCDEVGSMDFIGYKDMLHESGVIPCIEIQDYRVDLIYSKYSVKRNEGVRMKINEERFKEMIEEVGMAKFPELEHREAGVKLVRMYIWPYLLLRRKEI